MRRRATHVHAGVRRTTATHTTVVATVLYMCVFVYTYYTVYTQTDTIVQYVSQRASVSCRKPLVRYPLNKQLVKYTIDSIAVPVSIFKL